MSNNDLSADGGGYYQLTPVLHHAIINLIIVFT